MLFGQRVQISFAADLIFSYPLTDRKMGEDPEEVTLGFASKNSSTMPDLTKGPDSKADPIQMPPLTFSKVSASEGMSVQYSAVQGTIGLPQAVSGTWLFAYQA